MLYFLTHYAQRMYTGNDRSWLGTSSVPRTILNILHIQYTLTLSTIPALFFSDEWNMCPADIKPLAQGSVTTRRWWLAL